MSWHGMTKVRHDFLPTNLCIASETHNDCATTPLINIFSITATKKELDNIKKKVNESTDKLTEKNRQYQKLQVHIK